jgi:hypothetical protein
MNHSSKPAWTNSSERPYLEKPFRKKKGGGGRLVEWLKV